MSNYLKKELYKHIREDPNFFDLLQQIGFDGIWYLDLEDLEHKLTDNPKKEWVSNKFWKTLGYSSEEKTKESLNWKDFIFQEDLDAGIISLEKHLKDPNYKYSQITRFKHRNGSTIWMRFKGFAIRDKHGNPIRILGTYTDLTRLKQTERNLEEAISFLKLTLNASEDLIFVKDENFKIIHANKAFLSIFPKEIQDKIIGAKTLEDLNANILLEQDKIILKRNNSRITDEIAFKKGDSRITGELILPGGRSMIVDTHKKKFYDQNNKPFILGIARDVSQRENLLKEIKEKNEKLKQIAYTDQLTGLPNRTYIIKKIDSSIELTNINPKESIAILYIELNKFNFIYDSFGYNEGDRLKITISERLKGLLTTSSTLAKVGESEFAILLEKIDDLNVIGEIIQKILSAITEPYSVNQNFIRLSTNIGIATYPNSANNAEKLLQFANIAMYNAKERGANTYSFYYKEYDEKLQRQSSIERELKNFNKENFYMLYQPQFDIEGKIYGVEALIRWSHPDLGNISPEEFIPIAEKIQKIDEIGSWVILKVLSDWKQLGELNLSKELKFSINVSGVQILEDNFLNEITSTFKGLNKRLFTLEITETHLLNDIERTKHIISKLNDIGFGVSLDDFGTGYSSLSYLANLPVKYLKIDKTFIQDLDYDKNKLIVKTIVQLAKGLNGKCVAEGVETIEQLNFLKAINCDIFQGYYFSKPISFTELKKILQSQHKT